VLRLWLQRVLALPANSRQSSPRALRPERSRIGFLGCVLVLVLAACTTTPLPPAPVNPATPSVAEQSMVLQVSPATPLLSATVQPSKTFTITISPSFSPTFTLTVTPSFTTTFTVTPLPTYVKLRGKVTIAQAVCHYGPGAPYLYKYGVYAGSNLEILRRVEGGNYIEVQAIGGNNPCWVRMDYMDIRGDVNALQPVHPFEVKLPISPYYAPPAWVRAERNGDEVRVEWATLNLRAGDDSEQTPYIIEAWVCQNGHMVFQPAGTYLTQVTIRDEAGCAEPSRSRLIAAEKHGYTRPLVIEWPQPVLATALP